MNTHDKYELPPLPEELIASMMLASEVRSLMRRYGERCASAAIEADRQRRGEPVAWMTEDGRVCSQETRDTAMPNVSRVLFNIPLYRTPQPAEPVTLECPKCGVDRAKEPCAGNLMDCEFKGVAHAADPVKVDAKASVPSDEDIFNELQAHGALTTINTVNAVRALLARYGQPASGHSAAPMDTSPGHSGQPAASVETVLSSLLGMQRFFGKWPEFVPAPEYIGAAYDAVKRMNSVLSAAPVAEQPAASAEPVGQVCQRISNEPGLNGSVFYPGIEWLKAPPPVGTKLYTAPVAAQPSVPDGWKLVPLEPTKEMYQAGVDAGGPGVELP